MPLSPLPAGTKAEDWTTITTNTGTTARGSIPANTAIYYNAKIQNQKGSTPSTEAYRYQNLSTKAVTYPSQVAPITKSYGQSVTAANSRYTQKATQQQTQQQQAILTGAKTVLSSSTFSGETIRSNIAQTGANVPRGSFNTAYYPAALATTKQDRIKFTMKEAGTRSTQVREGLNVFSGSRQYSGQEKGHVFLAVPNQITDSNSADWSSATMNPLQVMGASISLQTMASGGNVSEMLSGLLGKAMENLKNVAKEKGNRQALQVFLAQEAVGAQGLLSRLSGAVANPNIELLFNGPSLRPFTFSFRMSPRDDFEAKQVKQIIRFFKEGMSVQTTDQDIFLKSPNVFDIQFQSGDNGAAHTSLPKIKTCALIGCDVDYTPDGSYMTFDDPNSGYPMTCYQMTLRFNEIEPIYARDYNGLDENDIGY